MFFMPFGEIVMKNGSEIRVGAEVAFGAEYLGIKTAKSSDLLFLMLLTAFTVLFAALSLKFKGTKWATVGFSIVSAVYMLVIACSSPYKFIDLRGYPDVLSCSYVNLAPLVISLLLFVTCGVSVAYLLISDKLAVGSQKGELTIPKRIVKALRDYKGEIKKIVWPGPKAVIKNTIIVLVVCLLVGAFIWLIDFGLGALLDLLYR
jgi:preprotein translocase subunit SecE